VVNPENLQKQQEFAIELLKKQEPLPAVRPVLKPTGRKETIAGYSAEEYVATVGSSIFTYWLAKSLARLVPVLAQGVDPAASVYMLRFPDPAGFPGLSIRSVADQRIAGRRVVSTTTIMSLEEKPLRELDFAVPKGYTKSPAPGKAK
jgi:hypothetical protein